MAQWFRRFADQVTGSPMYRDLSIRISSDEQCLALAAEAEPSQPAPNLFFAAVHFLLAQNREEPLAKYYPSLGGQFEATPRMLHCFKEFCRKYETEISKILKSNLVQTNEVQRCAVLFPALKQVVKLAGKSNVALIDVGTSGGLSFLMDRVHTSYSDGLMAGPEDSPLRLNCESKGSRIPEMPTVLIGSRIGIDLNPINLMNESERAWNLALIWPDQLDRINRFQIALGLLKDTAIEFHHGRANQVLPPVISKTSTGELVCILHSFALNQFSAEDRIGFEKVLADASI